MKTTKRYVCSKCERLLMTGRFLLVKSEFGDFALCERCVKRGYLELLHIVNPTSQIQKILQDFRKFLKKFKIEVES